MNKKLKITIEEIDENNNINKVYTTETPSSKHGIHFHFYMLHQYLKSMEKNWRKINDTRKKSSK